MKKTCAESLCKRLQVELSGFNCKGNLMYAVPLGHVMRAFYFEGSAFSSDTFYVNAFVLPLYVPSQDVHFNFGRRLRSPTGQAWNAASADIVPQLLVRIRSEGLGLFEGADRIQDGARVFQRLGAATDPYQLEATAYALVMAGECAAGQQALNALTLVLSKDIDWQAEMSGRATLLAKLVATNPLEAKQLLRRWERQTVENLGLCSEFGEK